MMIQLLPLSAKGGTEIALLKEGYKSHELLNENNEQKIIMKIWLMVVFN